MDIEKVATIFAIILATLQICREISCLVREKRSKETSKEPDDEA